MTNIVKNKNGIEFDIDAIATDLNGKMDRDCLNRSDVGGGVMASMAMPSNKYIDLTPINGASYPAPADGYLSYRDFAGGRGAARFTNLSNGMEVGTNAPDSTWLRAIYIPVLKGQNIQLNFEEGGTNQQLRFIYAVGSEHEAT